MKDNLATTTAGADIPSRAFNPIGDTLSRMRMLIGRRIVARAAIANTVPGLELSHLDALDAMQFIDGEVTVGAIAERMRIDPSRGSRLVAELVGHGVLRRDASQEDGRRSLLVRTKLGDKLLAERRTVKMALLADVLADWSEEELESFSRLFEKFVDGFETAAARGVANAGEQRNG
ncbi:MarR family transcriptional regulator [Rhizobium sp. 0TCS1.26]|uniref:MarR family winged helix-turn-helix transcriptional regulator n=1 Tax=Rhizobium sp. 0TCS1.26 TaxID=3142623 RepID=UPI003D28E614